MSSKVRYQLYLDADMSGQLEDLAAKHGNCKSAILTDALRAYLNRRGAKELDDLLGVRLSRLEHDQQVVLESLGLFVQYYLTVTAPVNDQDKAALAIGQDRFDLFIRQVGRRLASGKHLTYEGLTRSLTEVAA